MMFLVIFRLKGERYEMTFTAGERPTAEHFARRYGTTVKTVGAMVIPLGNARKAG